MDLFRNVLFMLVGVVVTYNVLDVTPRDEWLATAAVLGLSLTAALVFVEVVFQLIRRRSGQGDIASRDRASSV